MSTAESASRTRISSSSPSQPRFGGSERHILAHRRHEELVVRVLEDDAHPPADLLEVLLDHG